MKKLFKRTKKQVKPEPIGSTRITNETVAEYRERILAGGRKFKYPVQYSTHKIVLNSILIVVVATILLLTLCWWQLYPAQNTSQFMYRVTQILPLPAANVNGEWVKYSDYLVELRSALHYLESKETVNFSTDDGKRQLAYQKRLALDKAIENAYANRLARENNITVSRGEVDAFIKQQIEGSRLGVTEDVYKQVIKEYYDWSFDEYKDSVRRQLLRKKVVTKIDTNSESTAQEILQELQKGTDFATVAKQRSEDTFSKANGGDIGVVPKNSDDPNGLIREAAKLQAGKVSGVIAGVDGYYIIKLIESRDTDVHFAQIYIRYKEFENRMESLRKDNKISEYISVPQASRDGQ